MGHLAALWAFAFVQPLLDLLGRNAEFFVARGNGRVDILLFAFAFTLAPPAVLLALEWLAARVSRRAAAAVHLTFVAALVGAIVLGAINESQSMAAGVLFALAILVGAVAALAYRAAAAGRSLLSFLIPAPAVFLVLFLVGSQVFQLVRPDPDIDGFAVSGERDAPVLVIVFDELPVATLMTRAGGIDSRRFPNFGRLARSSTWYPEATSVADRTEQAVPAILTGLEADPERESTASNYPRNLFSLFAGSYELNVWESATRLCPPSLCGDLTEEPLATRMRALASDLRLVSQHLLLPRSITANLAPIDQGFFGFEGAVQTRKGRGPDEERLASLLEGFERNGRNPSLSFIHFDVPHVPWTRLPDGRRCQSDTFGEVRWTDEDSVWVDDGWSNREGLAAHLLQVGYADRLLGEVIDGLREQGVWDDTAVLVTSDHGASFIPGEARRTLSPANAGATLRIPFFVKAPGQDRPAVSDRHARTVDVLPTVADLVGADLPFEVDGVAAGEAPDSPEVTAFGDYSGGFQTVQRSDMDKTQAELTRLKEDVLGGAPSLRAAFDLGPRPDLLGAPAQPLASGANEGAGYELVAPELYDDVSLERSPPCQLVAILEDVEEGSPLAVTVNGRVAATTRAYTATTGDSQAFALIDPSRMQAGDNEVELWRIEGTGDDVELTPIAAG